MLLDWVRVPAGPVEVLPCGRRFSVVAVKSLPGAKQRLVVRGGGSRLRVTPLVPEILTCVWCLGGGAVARINGKRKDEVTERVF